MTTEQITFPRGSEWRKWDLHIHTPASYHWNGAKFDNDIASAKNKTLVDEMITALNEAEPAVFALMDYWTFDGWFLLKRRLSEPDAPKLMKTVFPGIELRLVAPMKNRLNAHVIFSNQIEDQVLHDFKSSLSIERINRPLSDHALMTLARNVGADKLEHHGYRKAEVNQDDYHALQAGSTICEISCDSYKNAIKNVPERSAVGFMPFTTNDGLAAVDWREHYAYCLGLFDTSPIFETRAFDVRAAFVGEETAGNMAWISNFQNALKNIPRLAVSGSDAHRFKGVAGDDNQRGYGDFPGAKATWIKADPTFSGLLQAIKEPAKRSFMGVAPPKILELRTKKSQFINRLDVWKLPDARIDDHWLDEISVPLNPDLVAVIGNKGSGKSALADVVALLGNSKRKRHFSFLRKDRFRGKTGDPAKHFVGKLLWHDDNDIELNLNTNPPEENVELVKYIPQGHFEELCNAHVSQDSDAFEKELRSVIFSHLDSDITLGALDFDQLVEKQEAGLREQLSVVRSNLAALNQRIERIEFQLYPSVRQALKEKYDRVKLLLDEHEENLPGEVKPPAEELSGEQSTASEGLGTVAATIQDVEAWIGGAKERKSKLSKKRKSIVYLREKLHSLDTQIRNSFDEMQEDLANVGIERDALVTWTTQAGLLDQAEAATAETIAQIEIDMVNQAAQLTELLEKQSELKEKLNAPQLAYQAYLGELKEWQARKDELVGTDETPDTLQGLGARIEQLDNLPAVYEDLIERRIAITGEVFDLLESMRSKRAELFKPVEELIHKNVLIPEEYRLQFQASLRYSIGAMTRSLFEMIKQNAGELRGEDESVAAVTSLADRHDFSSRKGVTEFVSELHQLIEGAAKSNIKGVNEMMRKDVKPCALYDWLFGLEFVGPRYSLLFQNTQLEQLSPGQRGSLLLIFYLLVDTGCEPMILDQPEENLDNGTVVNLLVPVLIEAKKRRQVIMVTHNPNLAVVCDAEQIIYCEFDRKNGSRITYSSGSIESPQSRQHVIDVLEGTMRAFDNRRVKYAPNAVYI